VSTDRTEIRRVCFTPDQFVDECVKQIQILTKHIHALLFGNGSIWKINLW